jgi:hypothetical protein
MHPNRYTELSLKASDRYQAVLTTFRGMLFGALSEPFSERAADQLRKQAVEVGRMFLRSEVPLIEEAVTDSAQDALETVRVDLGVTVAQTIPDRLSAFLHAHMDYLESELRAQLSRDVEALIKRYREHAIEAHLARVTTGQYVAPKAITADKSRFYFRDRVGRLYPSTKFVRTTWRQTLLVVAAEFYALEAAELGATSVEVIHEDKNAAVNGMLISLDGSFEPAFLDVRDEVFHPQAQVVLKAHVPS